MKLRIFNFIAGTSLALAVAIALFWPFGATHPWCRVTMRWVDQGTMIQSRVRAIGWDDRGVHWHEDDETYYLNTDPTSKPDPIRRFFTSICPANTQLQTWASRSDSFVADKNLKPADLFARTGSSWGSSTEAFRYLDLIIPLMILPSIALLMWVYRRRRRRELARIGLCPNCGYDLRATPGRCPECGMIPGNLHRSV